MSKRSFSLAFVALAFVAATAVLGTARAAGNSKKQVIERVAAVVNESVILESELLQFLKPMQTQLDAISDERERERQRLALERQALTEMVDEELVLKAASEAKLEVGDAEVDKALEEVKRQNRMTDQQFTDALQKQGYQLGQYRKDVRRQILRLRAINVLVRPRVNVSDDELHAHYERMAGKSSSVTSVRVRHMLLSLAEHPSADEMNTARRRAGELVARVRAGEDFAALVPKNSMDEATKNTGGELGWFKRGELPTDWEEILFAMSDGEVRGPVRGPQGLHVFQVVEAKKEDLRPFEEVKEQLRGELYNEQMERQTKVWLEELHKKAHVDLKL